MNQSATPVRAPLRMILPLCLTLASLAGCGKAPPSGATAEAAPPKDGAIVLTPAQMAQAGIRIARAEPSAALPVGTVPGVVSLPPDARVAVTTPYVGTVLRVMVIQGQAVHRGDVLAVVRAAESVQYGAALARSQAELPVAAANAARLSQLAREGIIAPARADDARAALAAVQATVAENRRLLSIGGAGRDGTITLRAPIAGRVASVSVDAGALVGNGVAPFVVENVDDLRLDLQIPERLAGNVRIGMNVAVLDSGRTVSGRILSVGQSLDPVTRALTAKACLPADSGLVPGKSVMATITAAGGGGTGVTVPASAIARGRDGDIVFVRTANGFRPARISVAGQIGETAFVAAGLHPGESVATQGVAELKSLSQGQ